MHIKYIIKSLCKSNPVTEYIYKKFAYARADFREWKQYILPIYRAKWIDRVDVFLVLTPEHGNMGDHAIALATQELLNEAGASFFEITTTKLALLRNRGHMNVFDGHPIMVNGGGNLGTLWFDLEELFRQLILNNPKSSIFCLPNTAFYEDSDWGRQEIQNSVAVYNAHPFLKLYAREKTSFGFMHPLYKDVQLVPDMVLALNACKAGMVRRGCLLCLRNDCEKTRTEEDENIVIAQAKQLFQDNVQYTDMCVGHSVLPDQRDRELEAKFQEFRGAELVITDRLHGMIFCAITGTPCIVIDSKSPKVRGCYQWIKHLDYIKFCEDPDQIGDLYRAIPKTERVYTNEHLTPYYDKLRADILHAVQR